MELRQLRHFVAVAEQGHFTRAAESVHLSQSALSSSIRALEDELGVTLFERTTRSVVPTDAGTVLYPHAQRMLGEARDAVVALERLRTGEAGTLTLGGPCRPSPRWTYPHCWRGCTGHVREST